VSIPIKEDKTIKHTNYNIMKSAVDGKIKPSVEEINKINSFFLVRYVSNDPASIYIANALNCNSNIPIYAQYKFILHSTLDRVAFISYPKKEDKFPNKTIKIICNHFKVNELVAKEYIKILGEEKTQEILNEYKHIK
jgi:hypothetical protein